MQQARAPGDADAAAQLAGHGAGQVGHLDGVLEHVLSVAGAEMQAADEAHDLRVEPRDTRLKAGLLGGFLEALLDVLLGLLDRLLDAARVDAAVGEQALEGHAGGLTPHGVEAGQHDGLGGIVHDEVNARELLEGADVAALAADDAALHLIAGQRHDRDGGLSGLLDGTALDGLADDPGGLAAALLAGLALGAGNDDGRLARDLLLDFVQQGILGFLGRQVRDLLEGQAALLDEVEGFLLFGFQTALAVLELLSVLVQVLFLALDNVFAFFQALLGAVNLEARRLIVLLHFRLEADHLFLGG